MHRTFLAKIRQEKNLKSKDVAKAIGIARSHYTRIEKGKANPSWDVGCRLGIFFGIEACRLLQRDGDDDK